MEKKKALFLSQSKNIVTNLTNLLFQRQDNDKSLDQISILLKFLFFVHKLNNMLYAFHQPL